MLVRAIRFAPEMKPRRSMVHSIRLIDYVRVACFREACTRVNLSRLNSIKAKLNRAPSDEIERFATELWKEEQRYFRLLNALDSSNPGDEERRSTQVRQT